MTADTYSSTLGFLAMGTGNDNNAWGNNCNNSVFQIFEDAIANALTSAVTGGTLDLSGSPPPAAPSQVRYAALIFGGTLASNQIVKVPNLPKFWWVQNATAGAFTLQIQTPTGAASVAIPQNSGWQVVQCDGADNITVGPFNSQQIEMPDGSAAAPVYSNVNERNSGFYRAGTQDWRFAINGVDVLQVTGAGASSPSVVNILAPNSLQIGGGQLIPAGAEMAGAFIELPVGGWLWEDGGTYSRTTYANLFNAITKTCTGNTNSSTSITNLSADMRGKGLDGSKVEGTGIPTGTTITFTDATTATLSQAATSTGTGVSLRIMPWGQGDASTTFNVPDRRYRTLVCRDDLNNNPATRSSAFAGARLATTAGEESHTLTLPEMASHGHGVTDPTHSHTISGGTVYYGFTSGTWQAGGGGNPGINPVGGAGINAAATGITIQSSGGGGSHNNMQPFGITNMVIKT